MRTTARSTGAKPVQPTTAAVLGEAVSQSAKTKMAFAHSAGFDHSRLAKYLQGGHDTSIDSLARILESNGLALRVSVEPLKPTR